MDKIAFLKERISIEDVVSKYVGKLVPKGRDLRLEDDECPFHGGNGNNFVVHVDGGYAKCFSGNCDTEGANMDIIAFTQQLFNLDFGQTISKLAEDFGVILPRVTKPQSILNHAQRYYRGLYVNCIEKIRILGGRTPEEYQKEVRGHSESTLDTLQIGWADGELHRELSESFTKEEMVASGMVFENEDGTIRDMIPKDSFVYPHIWNGISRFTFKCLQKNRRTGKPLSWQMKKEHQLNDVVFYRVGTGSPVAVVEGENDMASLLDTGWDSTIICTIGQLSREQVKWMCDNDGDYHTIFDNDDGGSKYRDLMWKAHATGYLPRLTQYVTPEVKDVDEYLRCGKKLEDLTPLEPPEREDIVDTSVVGESVIVVQDGGYGILKSTPDGKETISMISNFVIQLMYVKVANEERSRMVRIHRNDGITSAPIVVNSEAKVSLRHFKILVANAIDAKFKGSEGDLADMWDYIYSRQKESVVVVPPYVGCTENGGWLFAKQYVGQEGDIAGDDDNIMWFDDRKSRGIAPKSLLTQLSSVHQAGDIPNVYQGEDTEELLGGVVNSLATIFRNPGPALLYMGWLESCAYSMDLFHKANVGYFPFMLLWGRHGKGKSTVVGWGLSMYDMADKGVTTVGQIKSGVGIERKLAYYRGLPFCIDELRADRQAMEFYGTWRGWYNRTTRVKGTRSGESAITVPFNACLLFSGQDIFTDAAMRSRSIPIKFPSNAGDTQSFIWMQDNMDFFPEIGYMWVREAMDADIFKVKQNIADAANTLASRSRGVPNRTLNNYAIPYYFANRMAEKYFPDFDLIGYILDEINEEVVEASENDTVSQFWDIVSGLQAGERKVLDSNHILVKDNRIYLWMAEVYRKVEEQNRGREAFSKTAVTAALKDESYYVGSIPERLCNVQRRCMAFDIESAPDTLKAIVEASQMGF